jgi:inhibitor of KinA sporulation pathway (predicted exonuclease)
MTEPLLLVVDLECTCSDESTPASERVSPEQMEIIEIGAVISTLQGTVVDSFGHFVRKRAAKTPTLAVQVLLDQRLLQASTPAAAATGRCRCCG